MWLPLYSLIQKREDKEQLRVVVPTLTQPQPASRWLEGMWGKSRDEGEGWGRMWGWGLLREVTRVQEGGGKKREMKGRGQMGTSGKLRWSRKEGVTMAQWGGSVSIWRGENMKAGVKKESDILGAVLQATSRWKVHTLVFSSHSHFPSDIPSQVHWKDFPSVTPISVFFQLGFTLSSSSSSASCLFTLHPLQVLFPPQPPLILLFHVFILLFPACLILFFLFIFQNIGTKCGLTASWYSLSWYWDKVGTGVKTGSQCPDWKVLHFRVWWQLEGPFPVIKAAVMGAVRALSQNLVFHFSSL